MGIYIQEPPARFLPYTGPLQVMEQSFYEVNQTCRALGMRESVYGCQIGNKYLCTIVLDTDLPKALYEKLKRHELAHCNGWKHEPK
jgi:hypothetical protein